MVLLTPPLEFHRKMKHNKDNKQEVKNICPNCNSNKVVKRGKRKTQNRGLIQRYGCLDCKKRFVEDNGFFKMKNHPKKITCAIDLFYRGVSTRKVQEHFKAFYPHNSSNVTVYRWVVKYSKMISNFTDKLKINGGKEIQVDEVEYHRRQKHKKGTKGVSKDWFIDSIDVKTRYMVSCNYFNKRTTENINIVMKRAEYKTQGNITTVTTDGFFAYIKSVKNTFGYSNKTHQYKVFHNVVNASRGDGFNIYIERLHNSLRERTKTFRGFHGSVESADSIMKGWEIFYNFIRKHQSIKCCPYELATDLKLNNPNKWLGLIEASKTI